MVRSPRIEYYGAIYHIIHRGNTKAFIFEDNQDKVFLLQILFEVKEIFDFVILSYVIMDNHYHFLIKTYNIPISKIMHRINTRYAKYYNKRYERTGSPFEGRYRGILVENESYLICLTRYIHNNPVDANICNHMSSYNWSSDIFYRMNLDSLVNINELLDIFSEDRVRAIKRYKEVMDQVEDDSTLKEKFEDRNIIGTKKFEESINSKYNESKGGKRTSLDDILRQECPRLEDYNLIREGSRKRYLTNFKCQYIKKAIDQGYSTGEIAESLNISVSGVNNLIKNKQKINY